MTGRIFSLFPVVNFTPVTLSGHRNTVRGCYFEENSLDVSLLVLNSGCKLINFFVVDIYLEDNSDGNYTLNRDYEIDDSGI